MRKPACGAGDDEIDLSAECVLDRGCATAVRDVKQLDSRGDLEHLPGDMSGGPDATGRIRQGPRLRPGQPDELIECRRAHAGGRRDQHRRRAEERDWREIADEVDGCLTTARTPAGVAAVDQY